jgi:selenocysteine lyase/cysteine desulfurase
LAADPQNDSRADPLLAYRASEFPITERYAYLAHAAVGAMPRRTAQRMAALAESVSLTGDRLWSKRNEMVEETRGLAARLLGARRPHEVAFVENTSTALSMVATGLAWRAGENVVGARLEFPSNVYPWMQLSELGVEYRQVPERSGRIDTDELLAAVDEGTRIVALSWVQYASGFRCDLPRIGRFCRERGILFVVDVIQGLGGLVLDVERDGVDVAAASAHKWLLGPEGIGILYVSDRVIECLRPNRSGWRSVRSSLNWIDYDLTWSAGAKRLESGTLNVYGIAALSGSLSLLLEAGPEAIERRIHALVDRTAAGLAALGFSLVSSRRPGETSGILTATHPDHAPDALVERLAEQGILVTARAGRLRIAPHFYNSEEEIDRLLAALGSA